MKPIDKKVYLGASHFVEVKGIGAATLSFTDEDGNYVKLTLFDFLYLPDISRNLLSARCLREKGINSDFSTFVDRAAIHKGRMKIKSDASPYNKLYVFKTNSINIPTESACSGVGSLSIQLWHSRCGHLGFQNIAKLVSRGRAHELQVSKRDLVDFLLVTCVSDRTNIERHSSGRTRSTYIK